MTDGHGRAHTRWTPGSKVGQRTLLAAVKGTDARTSFVLEAPVAPIKPVAAVKAISPVKVPPAKKGTVKRAAH
jgi:hypothetical protein